jgi:hypothetical protein
MDGWAYDQFIDILVRNRALSQDMLVCINPSATMIDDLAEGQNGSATHNSTMYGFLTSVKTSQLQTVPACHNIDFEMEELR